MQPESKIGPLQQAAFRAHACSKQYQCRLAELRETVETRVQVGACYVSFSAGKDSSVIAHAVHARYPEVPILMVDPGKPWHWNDADVALWMDYIQAQRWNFTSFPWDKSGAVDGTLDALHASMFTALDAYAKERGLTQRIMGMRQQESRGRAMLVATKGDAYEYVGGGSALLPIAKWRTEDVWAYIVTNDLPWLSIYDAFGHDTRNGIVGVNGLKHGRIARLREHDVDAYLFAQRNIADARSYS